jgi:hypothetical protein
VHLIRVIILARELLGVRVVSAAHWSPLVWSGLAPAAVRPIENTCLYAASPGLAIMIDSR